MESYTQISTSEGMTRELGRRLGASLSGGEIITLQGSLGSGKTVFTKGLAKALHIGEEIISPTYTIIQEYSGSLSLHHMDLYRITSMEDFDMLGAEEELYGEGVSVIEWSEVIDEILPDSAIRVNITIGEHQERTVTIRGAAL